jgi:1-acyl-sn-glycerol-3-phosphate acyltransferase
MTGSRRGATIWRRLRTIPLFVLILLVSTGLLPLLLLGAFAVDVVRALATGKPWMATRIVLFGWCFVAIDVSGVTIALLQWIGAGFGAGRRRRLLDWGYGLQRWWARALFSVARRLFSLRFEVTGEDAITPGPIIAFFRHASIVDNLLPAVFVLDRHSIRLRWVIKQELLADPALDVGGHRIPNYFVDRSSRDGAGEIDRIAALASGLAPNEGVLLFPEGTRFTPQKQQRVLEKLAGSDPRIYDRARRLRHVLPPRVGGPLALLDSGYDVVFCTHVGLDGFADVADIWEGGLVGRTVRLHFWRIDGSVIPQGRRDRIEWLYEQWQALDDWIARHLS